VAPSRFSVLMPTHARADVIGWPPCLKVATSPGIPEQAAVFAAIERGGEPWIAALRWAVDRVIDRVALDHLQHCAQTLAERDAIVNSSSWRLTRPLRALHGILRRSRS
jgi:hypothetical protein